MFAAPCGPAPLATTAPGRVPSGAVIGAGEIADPLSLEGPNPAAMPLRARLVVVACPLLTCAGAGVTPGFGKTLTATGTAAAFPLPSPLLPAALLADVPAVPVVPAWPLRPPMPIANGISSMRLGSRVDTGAGGAGAAPAGASNGAATISGCDACDVVACTGACGRAATCACALAVAVAP